MKLILKPFMISIVLLIGTLHGYPQAGGNSIQSIFLIGDCGEARADNEPVWKVFRKQIETAGDATVLFLGDNIYDRGLPEKSNAMRKHAEKILAMQTDIVNETSARAILIPGNHDWAHWGKRGYKYVLNQQQWIDSLRNDHVMIQPRDACPGPVEIALNNATVLVILDTQWLLHRHEKPGAEICSVKDAKDLYSKLENVFERHPGKRVVVAAHHPLYTYGIHGGVLTWRSHLFPLTDLSRNLYVPLPLLGSVYAFYRKWYGSIQDTPHPKYKAMKKELVNILSRNPGTLYVSGHEHALQYIEHNGVHFLGSGSGAKTEHVKKKRYAKFAKAVRGFIRMDVAADGSITLRYFRADHKFPDGKEIYAIAI